MPKVSQSLTVTPHKMCKNALYPQSVYHALLAVQFTDFTVQ